MRLSPGCTWAGTPAGGRRSATGSRLSTMTSRPNLAGWLRWSRPSSDPQVALVRGNNLPAFSHTAALGMATLVGTLLLPWAGPA